MSYRHNSKLKQAPAIEPHHLDSRRLLAHLSLYCRMHSSASTLLETTQSKLPNSLDPVIESSPSNLDSTWPFARSSHRALDLLEPYLGYSLDPHIEPFTYSNLHEFKPKLLRASNLNRYIHRCLLAAYSNLHCSKYSMKNSSSSSKIYSLVVFVSKFSFIASIAISS